MNFMKIVEKICSIESTDCRSLNKSELARKLMDMVNIPQNAEIQEIPLDWNDQVEILFTIPEDKYYYGLNAGHWLDGEESMYLEIIGVQRKAQLNIQEGMITIGNLSLIKKMKNGMKLKEKYIIH